ncbi:nucleoside phosphorylase [Flavilitoribacter nigricans]|uniref:Uridine phosphorylase n=1 Tax=Flavilitoribacter nigricans (strain ATCC 23147 / DSM 23189 / NBRC 102662 / NCIMB 1420 / SS-2) TaxID=1122177 RepID=A0A2D0NBH8_FLAN2|nr:nucleoside phosphorylase [Flavilitoribacter nigricans]PHN05845.1 phosphorylase [Flavilitoribacter nigricans DSM 23189 = NBRC 102662]
MSTLSPSELVLNPDGSIYHLHLRPEHLADTIITVGDPDRVPKVSQYFDELEFSTQKREFVTHTGRIGNKRLTVLSTGIGPDNIDIVLNELDALANIDLENRTIRSKKRQLNFIRVGTTGGLQADHPVGTLVSSSHTIGMDNLLHFYDYTPEAEARELLTAFTGQFPELPVPVYAGKANPDLLNSVTGNWAQGITITFPGFYAPQGRSLRLASRISPELLDSFADFSFRGTRITNFEMETSALLCLAGMLGHRAISCSVILANRHDGTFSQDSAGDVDRLIRTVLEQL